MLIAAALFATAAYQNVRLALVAAGIALAAEIAAALLLLVHEAQPAYLHPEWDWYWPVVNSLYFGGLVVGLITLATAAIRLAVSRTRVEGVALVLAVAALVVNRIAQYR